MQEYIDKKSKKESLDTALLFFSSSFGIWFTVIHIFFGESALLTFLPTLFLGWFMPVYIGFIRGSMILDLVVERERGWIYLIVGVGLYISSLVESWLLGSFIGVTYVTYAVLGSFIGVTYAVTAGIITARIHKIFGLVLTDQIGSSYRYTIWSAISMYVIWLLFIGILQEKEKVIGSSIVICIIAFAAIYCEIKARRNIFSYDEKESEMGTNPYGVDSDGDGLKDPEDPNPTVPEERHQDLR